MFQQAWTKSKPLISPPAKPWEDLEVEAVALHMWEEHCVECAPPDCYASCALFEKRLDLKCARFVSGIVRNEQTTGIEGAAYEIHFKRWAKLETKLPQHVALFSMAENRRLGARLNGMEQWARWGADLMASIDPKRKIQGAQYAYHQRLFPKWASAAVPAHLDGFFIELYAVEEADFTLEMVGNAGVLLRHSISMKPGWNRFFVDGEQWPRDLPGGALLRLVNNEDRVVSVVISAIHLVRWKDRQSAVKALAGIVDGNADGLPKLKCVVFDLDNTLWQGIIGDDGPEGVAVRQEVVDFIHQLDARGIICAVASKNEFDVAWQKIESMGLSEYLLFPQIHWGPKSESVKAIADAMNVSLDTFAFIDDNPFERQQVQSALPMVRVFDEQGVLSLLDLDDFDVPVTEQSGKRRLSYLAESKRTSSRVASGHDLDVFLRSCNMHMRLMAPKEHKDRCLEMLDRTNQFNISGKRYSAEEFDLLLEDGFHCCWAVKDDFGDYGIVGYLNANQLEGKWVIRNFVMSCRVAHKRIEEALFNALSGPLLAEGGGLFLELTRTSRNQAIISKLSELGVETADGLVRLNSKFPGAEVIKITSEQ